MKTKILKICNRQIIFLLSVLGFALASNQCAAQYGAPPAQFELKGFVKTEKKSPIKNIRIIIKNDTIYSDSNGYFKYKTFDNDRNEKKMFDLNFTDVDGIENGSYLQQNTKVFIKPDEELKIDIIMKKKD